MASETAAAPAAPKRILVVFYSRDGRTRRLATRIASACQGDLEEIAETGGPRSGQWGYLRSALEALFQMATSVKMGRFNPQDYALVVLCTPVWARHVASPVRRYLQLHRQRLPQVATFCTHGGSGHAGTLRELARLAGREPVASLALSAEQCDAGAVPRELQRYTRDLLQAVNPDEAQPGGWRGRRAA